MNDVILYDRIEKIKNDLTPYLDTCYLSFSGGKDSTVLSYLLDLAIPNNKIPRVFCNTGIEYNDILDFVLDLKKQDDRIIIINANKSIKETLETKGYPFKSKEHSQKVYDFWNRGYTKAITRYLFDIGNKYLCPKILEYQFKHKLDFKISKKCCEELKKKPFSKYMKENHKTLVLTGMRQEEGGTRNNLKCIITNSKNQIIKYHPLATVNEQWLDWFIKENNIKLCKLYYPPFNFKRTGCKGCPYSLDLQKQLDVMEEYLPKEKKQIEIIWRPVYEEYRRLGYRLAKVGTLRKKSLFEEEL